MTFNVRGSQHPDGPNAWKRRAALNVEVVRRYAPDLIGLQEFQEGNLATYESELPGYEHVLGLPYENREPYAHNAVYWNPERLQLRESGGFWLSETPRQRSRSWKSSHVRSATWARFRLFPEGTDLLHLNTHLDHLSGRARVEGSRLIARTLEDLGGRSLPVLLTGDFNCNPGSKTYGIYEGAGFADAHRVAGNPPAATFHRFRGLEFKSKVPGRETRLDWVLLRGGAERRWTVLSCTTVRDSDPPRYPSDHYPVLARLSLEA